MCDSLYTVIKHLNIACGEAQGSGNARSQQTAIINAAFEKKGGAIVSCFNSPTLREVCMKQREKYMDDGAQGMLMKCINKLYQS